MVLPDAFWDLIEPLLPSPPPRAQGGPQDLTFAGTSTVIAEWRDAHQGATAD